MNKHTMNVAALVCDTKAVVHSRNSMAEATPGNCSTELIASICPTCSQIADARIQQLPRRHCLACAFRLQHGICCA